MAFAEFRVAILDAAGRMGKPRRLRADIDDPTEGDAIFLKDAWHEIVKVAHLPDEDRHPPAVGAVVICKLMESPPPWLLDLAGGGRLRAVPSTTPGAAPPKADGGKVLQLAQFPQPADEKRGRDPFSAPTVEREIRISQLRTAEHDYSANAPVAPIEHITGRAFMLDAERPGMPTLRMLAPAGARVIARATGIHERPTAMRPRPAPTPTPTPMPTAATPPVRRRQRRSRALVLALPVAAGVMAVVALAVMTRPHHQATMLPSVDVEPPVVLPTPMIPPAVIERSAPAGQPEVTAAPVVSRRSQAPRVRTAKRIKRPETGESSLQEDERSKLGDDTVIDSFTTTEKQ